MPAWVTPDRLTALGFAASVLIFASYALTRIHPAFLWLATLGFIINWFGDSLDGTLARHRKIERPKYGYYLDHSIDALSEVLIFLGAGLSAYLHFEFAALALIGYLLISLHVFLSTYVMGEFRLSYLGLGPTETRVIAILTNAVLFFAGRPVFRLLGLDMTLYDVVALFMAALFFGIFIVASLSSSAALAKVEEEKKVE
jgi:archaetidylinositol phosphate synthase